MAALAALRAGAGLVTAAVPAPALPLVAAVAPELMTLPLAATPAGSIAAENLAPEQIAALMAGKTVLAIGPGLGQSPETVKFTTGLLSATKIPAVIDADALNILAAKPVLLAKLAKGRTLVLTPHPGEMARLAGIPRGRGAGQPAGGGARLCPAHRRHAGAQGRAHAHRPSRWPRGRQHKRQSRHGQGRQRRSADRADRGPAGAASRTSRRGPWRRPSICMGWPPIWPCARPRAHAAGHRQLAAAFRAFRFRFATVRTGIFGCRGCRRKPLQAAAPHEAKE